MLYAKYYWQIALINRCVVSVTVCSLASGQGDQLPGVLVHAPATFTRSPAIETVARRQGAGARGSGVQGARGLKSQVAREI